MHRLIPSMMTVGVLVGASWAAAGAAQRAAAQDQSAIAVYDIQVGSGSSAPRYMTPLGDKVVFSADDGALGRELWVSDGTPDGTHILRDIRPGPQGSKPIAGGESEFNPVPTDARTRFTQVGDRLFFVADDGQHGREVWLTDGSEAGTRMLADVTDGGEEWSVASFLTAHEGKLFFMGDDGFDGEELWVSDGSEAGTTRVADIMEGPAGSLPAHLASTPVGLAFAAEHFDYGIEPWISDGTAEGTIMLGDIVPDFDGSEPSSFVGYEGALLFAASDVYGGGNYEPWISDGTPEGTRLLVDLNPSGRGFNLGFALHKDRLYFGGDNGQSGSEIWETDGSPEGTRLVADVASRGRGSVPSAFASFGDLLFFQAFHFSYGIEPWFTDGSEAGTRVLTDLNPGSVASSRPADATPMGELLYFSAERDGNGRELWETDGSAAGTQMLADIAQGPASSNPVALLAHTGMLFFSAGDTDVGEELRVLGGQLAPTAEASPTVGPTATPTGTSAVPHPVIYLPFAERAGQP